MLVAGIKLPGQMVFIRTFWCIIKEDLMLAIRWFWNASEISRGCNPSFVALIPKVTNPIGLSDFRPISLIGCYYKIIAKVLAERIKRVMSKIIGDILFYRWSLHS